MTVYQQCHRGFTFLYPPTSSPLYPRLRFFMSALIASLLTSIYLNFTFPSFSISSSGRPLEESLIITRTNFDHIDLLFPLSLFPTPPNFQHYYYDDNDVPTKEEELKEAYLGCDLQRNANRQPNRGRWKWIT